MKKFITVLMGIFALTISNSAFCQSFVILTPNSDEQHIMLGGTTTSSGPQSAIYGFRNHLQQVGNDPYTFKSELFFSFAFSNDDAGRGKILNVSNLNASVRATCYDYYGNAVETKVINIKPRTFSRIMFDYDYACSSIRCELIGLY